MILEENDQIKEPRLYWIGDRVEVAIQLEETLIGIINKLKKSMQKKKKSSFFTQLLTSLRSLGYAFGPGGATYNHTRIEDLSTKQRGIVYRCLFNKISRANLQSSEAIIKWKESQNTFCVKETTLAQLPFIYFFIIYHGVSDIEIIELFKGNAYTQKITQCFEDLINNCEEFCNEDISKKIKNLYSIIYKDLYDNAIINQTNKALLTEINKLKDELSKLKIGKTNREAIDILIENLENYAFSDKKNSVLMKSTLDSIKIITQDALGSEMNLDLVETFKRVRMMIVESKLI